MGNLIGAAALRLYGGAGRLAAPFVSALLDRRARAGKEDPARRGERFGIASLPRPKGPLIWVHAASVGETVAILPLVERLAARGVSVLLTTVTVTSASVAAGRLPKGALHQYVPVDLAPALKRFLRHWRPALAIFAESELWPTTLGALRRRRIPLVVANARMTERSYGRWRLARPLIRTLLGRVDLLLAQSDEDAVRFRALGARTVVPAGNLKFDAPPLPVETEALRAILAEKGERPIFLAASTHDGEERVALHAHERLKRSGRTLLTVLAPRHPRRGKEVEAEARGMRLKTARRSKGEAIAPDTEIYIADTVGEMGLWYRVADAAMIGGSYLGTRGSQSPIEPAMLGVPILHGPKAGNFGTIYDALAEAKAARGFTDSGSLALAIEELWSEPAKRARRVEAAKRCVARFTGALDRTVAALEPYLAKLEGGEWRGG